MVLFTYCIVSPENRGSPSLSREKGGYSIHMFEYLNMAAWAVRGNGQIERKGEGWWVSFSELI